MICNMLMDCLLNEMKIFSGHRSRVKLHENLCSSHLAIHDALMISLIKAKYEIRWLLLIFLQKAPARLKFDIGRCLKGTAGECRISHLIELIFVNCKTIDVAMSLGIACRMQIYIENEQMVEFLCTEFKVYGKKIFTKEKLKVRILNL